MVKASVKDADQSVGQGAKRLVVSFASSAES